MPCFCINGDCLHLAIMRRAYYLCLLLTLLLPTACRKQADDGKMVFRYNQAGGLETLDPAFAKSIAIIWATHMLYNTLLEADSNMQTVPSLAKGYESSDDGLHYTFHLRGDVYFHDNEVFAGGRGRRMTATDVLYSFNRLIDPAEATAGAWVFNGRVRKNQPFEAPDDSTFVLHLSAPFRPLPQILTMQYCSIVPREAVQRWGKDYRSHPCGTGPFIFHHWDEGNTLILHKNEHYWERDNMGKPLPYLDAVQVYFNETRALEFLLFNQGRTDFMNGVDGSMKDLVLTRKGALRPEFAPKARLQRKPYLYTEYLGILQDTLRAKGLSALQLKKVRQAINYAIDRKKIVTYFRNGVGIPAGKGHGFVAAGLPSDAFSSVAGYEYSPEKALALLAEAGFPGGKGLPLLTLTAPDAYADVCNFVATQLNEVGIRTQVQVVLLGLMRQMMVKNELSFFKAGWVADYPDAETFLACFYGKLPSPPNYTLFKNATFDHWYEQSLQMANDTARLQLYARMDSLISAEAPVVPLFYDQILHFTQKNITGWNTNALNIIDLRRVRKSKNRP
ncbi:MAG: ABC transporter substrate-binding protein [Edaphocola sp.]